MRIPGRTKEEKKFDSRILAIALIMWAIYHPADDFTRQASHWM